ncbi:MAG: PilE-like protein [Candidatus Falkowbacteria bacterium GW2011_GWC2_38_22]|uniref:PilE-like protein n=1 Tax=Candidatus Falkowbacteria bacterium GW2011_GWE1_38_31 TaxID=1618638 RepID=A0A0G0M8E3_9BACT|nr:MAG: PilE-like protein [Candidatus Falkowbacteria bacterium GW2011_GWF2_38_1205]KKQ61102.1 MAG: PilE-like protein [Candidatus Falkowbacteria bacterium GW2011_GWC2_38_22]KKQ63172.1 MAG: PilE-like protein [Candidatus Falkowbacteria bacterium GW2011_GWF1_38_22]KKQ65367.1 MAG: PilE-like protein [Candidatus Falkowbacteria bacterium GW2011_GWE2_38_254]KKQ69944.1 MAG: PilE-like protein [Candidatus Falkowbacteria bacterium GW2011_GWE1_38_31]KKQ72508.1 MAG: PilE-like protein [Candidatus Falkowbacter
MKINKKGFTLIELLVVIAIIGLLSTLAVVSLNNARVKARDARRMSDLKQISTAMELFSSNQATNAYPTNNAAGCTAAANDQVAGAEVGGALENICAGTGMAIRDAGDVYLAAIPADPGTTNYQYEGSATSYCIQATLEGADTDYFVCTNGSCIGTDTACTAI